MKKIPRDDPRAQRIATSDTVDLDGLIDFATGKHAFVLSTTRRDGRPQMSLVTGTITPDGDLLISTYPRRAKANNARRHRNASVLVMGDGFSSAWIQIDGDAEVIDMPEATDTLVEYYRCISGEHPDWDEYRQAMADQDKSVIRIRPTRWGPISTGGFPPELFEDD
ncbi:MAG: PPOX class F420-dependent oxidoreductase [Actinomycetota bacterium]